MLIILLNLFLWFPALQGYGSVQLFLRRRICSDPMDVEYQFAEAFFGIIVLATIGSLLNFFVAITPTVVAVLLVIGWGLCSLRLSRLKVSTRSLLFLLIWMIFVSFWATQPPRNPDSALYHIQSIRWINENPVPLGLANLHQRFGFNTLWFPFAGILTLPVSGMQEVNYFSASAMLIYLFGIAVAQAIHVLRKESGIAPQHLFLLLSVLVIIGNVVRRNISSPSPDLPVVLLCLLSVYFGLEALHAGKDRTFSCFQLVIFALFAVMIKFSAVPLMLIPLTLLIIRRVQRISLSWRKLLGYCLIFGGVIVVIWLSRGVALSGCLAFPVAQTCSEKLSWSIPRWMAKNEWIWDRATARTLIVPVVSGWDWLSPWFVLLVRSIDFVLPMILILAAVLLFLKRDFASQGLWFSLPLLIALLFWFFTAPDLRFAAGYFWSLSILMLSLAIEKHLKGTRSIIKIVIPITVLILAVILPLRTSMYLGLPPIRKALRNGTEFFVTLPAIESQTQIKLTDDGVPIYVPVEGYNCSVSPLPCAPILHGNLVVEKSAEGYFKKFYFPK
ncbi:hypothetical protein L0156_24825 [bacterium]|nr:hypothetical protein [bacterium]